MRLLDLVSGPEYMKKQIGGDEVYYVIGVYEAIGLHSAIHLSPNTEVSLKYFDFQALPAMDAITVRLLDKIKKNS